MENWKYLCRLAKSHIFQDRGIYQQSKAKEILSTSNKCGSISKNIFDQQCFFKTFFFNVITQLYSQQICRMSVTTQNKQEIQKKKNEKAQQSVDISDRLELSIKQSIKQVNQIDQVQQQIDQVQQQMDQVTKYKKNQVVKGHSDQHQKDS